MGHFSVVLFRKSARPSSQVEQVAVSWVESTLPGGKGPPQASPSQGRWGRGRTTEMEGLATQANSADVKLSLIPVPV